MTTKELLYLEDILEHTKDLRNLSKIYLEEINEDLKDILSNVIQVTEDEYQKNCNLL